MFGLFVVLNWISFALLFPPLPRIIESTLYVKNIISVERHRSLCRLCERITPLQRHFTPTQPATKGNSAGTEKPKSLYQNTLRVSKYVMEILCFLHLFSYIPFIFNGENTSDFSKLSGRFIDIWKGFLKSNPNNIHVFAKKSLTKT
jgi:hypothetical protein